MHGCVTFRSSTSTFFLLFQGGFTIYCDDAGSKKTVSAGVGLSVRQQPTAPLAATVLDKENILPANVSRPAKRTGGGEGGLRAQQALRTQALPFLTEEKMNISQVSLLCFF